MNAMKNATHFAILALWLVLGILFTLKCLFIPALLPILHFWLWLLGYAAFTTFLANQFKSPLGALGTHAVTLFVLLLLPTTMPFSLVRAGVDLLF